jgi:putative heme-binding domain-containing protein
MRLLLWEVIHRAPLPRLPEPWLAALGSTLAQGSDATRREAIAIIRERELNQFDESLRKLAADPRQPLELRIEACAATAPRSQELSADLFRLLTGQLQGETSPLLRLAAAKALADAPLDEPQLAELARELPAAGPLATPVLLRAFARSSQEAIGRALVEALQKSPSATNLAADELARVIGGYPAPVQDAARDLLKKLGSDLESQQRRLAELAPVLNGGNPAQGRAVFYSQKAACASCHAIGGQGGKVGPDLTKIGGIRAGRDLLEAITFPSASFAREFRSYNIVTDRGRVFTGVISRQTADAVYLRTAELAEIRVPRAEIDEMSESAVSLMPKGLDQILSESELRDLLAFLQQQK